MRLRGGHPHKLRENEVKHDIIDHKTVMPNVSYREVIGCLLWISMGTRPDITYAVNQCARYSLSLIHI